MVESPMLGADAVLGLAIPLILWSKARQLCLFSVLLFSQGGNALAAASSKSTLPPILGPSLNPDKALTQYVHRSWTGEDGLPQNSVNSIVQCEDGYLWLATFGGLVRFDGVEFRVFNTATATARGLLSNRLTALAFDASGNLWIGTEQGELIIFQDGRFQPVERAQDERINSIVFDAEGKPIVATWRTTYRLEDGGLIPLLEKGGRARVDGDRLWVTGSKGIYSLSGGQVTRHGTAGAIVSMKAADGETWLGTANGLAQLDVSGAVRYLSETGIGDTVTALAVDRRGTLWLGTREGALIRMRGERVDRLSTPLGIPPDPINAIFEDREGTLWVGTSTSGLHQFVDGPVTALDQREGLADQIGPVVEGPDGAVWLGGDCGGVWRRVGGDLEEVKTFKTDCYRDFHFDDQGNMWIAAFNGLLRLGPSGESKSFPVEDATALLDDGEGGLWIGTLRRGLFHLVQGSLVAVSTPGSPGSQRIYHLSRGREGRMWIGTAGGLGRLASSGIEWFDTSNGLSNAHVRDIYHDADGSLWIALYGGGLNRFRRGRFAAITGADGLCDDFLSRILEDGQGRLWFNGNAGIFYAEKELLHALADKKISRMPCTLLGRESGMKTVEGRPGGAKTSDGRLWFPNIHGISIVDPAALTGYDVSPKVVAQSLISKDLIYPDPVSIQLPTSFRRLEIRYGAISFRNPKGMRFEYLLDGYDDAWVDAGNRRSAYYTNLEPGVYNFRVRVKKEAGGSSASAASLTIEIPPYFYETLWFQAGIVLVCAALVGRAFLFLIVRQRKRGDRFKAEVERRTVQLSQQAALARLGQLGVEQIEWYRLLDEATGLVAAKLDAVCGVLELQPEGDQLRLRSGLGWKEGSVGQMLVPSSDEFTVGAALGSGSGACLVQHSEPNIDRQGSLAEFRCSLTAAILERDQSYGVLGVYSSQQRRFSRDDVNFVQAVANILTANRVRNLDEQRIKSSLREKEVLLREIHHRVKNNLQIIASLLNLQVRENPDERLQRLVASSQIRIRSMALVHEKLYSSETISRIDFTAYVRDLVSHLVRSCAPRGKHIQFNLQIKQAYLFDIDIALPLALIVAELVSNSLQHAFADRDIGCVNVSLHNNGDSIILKVEDDGMGCPECSLKRESALGLRLVEALSEQLEATFEYQCRPNGTSFKLEFEPPRFPKRSQWQNGST